MTRPIRTLFFSTLYSSSVRPFHGIFVETRLCELLKSGQIESKVVAPAPWFSFTSKIFGEYGEFSRTPRYDFHNQIDVFHQQYFLPPKVGMNIAPFTLAKGAMPTITRLIRDGFYIDPIDAHYYYPDAVPAYIEAFDIALQPAVTSYAFPLKLMEYLVLGKAIVARRMENLLEILTDGQNATMFDDSAPGALAEAYTELCRDHDLRHRLSVAL